ncbi:MAG: glycoside hydrolase family 43 protein [Flavobacteriaceae bacterium]
MQKLLVFIVALIALGCAEKKEAYLFTSFREPATDGLYLAYSTDGCHWNDLKGPYLKPEVGVSGIMRDPSIIKGKNGIYHMVWTTEWRGGNGFGYANSKDLIQWDEQQYVPVMANEPEVVNVWAPELFYDDEADQYIIIWASTIPFRYEKGEEEEENNHRMYYVTTKDFKTFSETKLFFNPGFSVIDCVIVKRNKNDYVLVLKDNTRPMRNLKVAFGKSALGPFENISEPFSGFLSEGPTVLKQDEEYLIYFDNYGEKNYKAVRTSNFKTFEDITANIKLPEGHKHGTITTISEAVLNGLIEESKTK